MANTQFFDQVISVSASFDAQGQIAPTDLTWQEHQFTVTAVGRQWDEEDGRHILVESGQNSRFEILLSREDLLWRLKRAWQEALAA